MNWNFVRSAARSALGGLLQVVIYVILAWVVLIVLMAAVAGMRGHP